MRRAVVTLGFLLLAESAGAQTSGYKLARTPRMGLVATGGGMLAAGFVAAVITAAVVGFRGVSPLVMIPLAGPFVGVGWDLAHPSVCPLDVPTNGCNGLLVDPGLVAIGLVEVTGAVLLAVGLVPHEVRTKVTVTPTFAWRDGPFAGFSVRF